MAPNSDPRVPKADPRTSKPDPNVLAKKAKKELDSYYIELRRRKQLRVAGIVIVSFCSLLFAMVLAGETFNPILSWFGLRGFRYQERGVYADCSKPENKDISYCQPKQTQSERNWESISKGQRGGFNLYQPSDK